MEYKYCDKKNYEDFASGRVLYQKTGIPNFPVRLAQECFKRGLNYLDKKNNISLYDPLCGGGYMLTVLGFLNNNIESIYGSDINKESLEIAVKNLNLLSEKGLEYRISQLNNLYEKYSKNSHFEAIKSAKILLVNLQTSSKKINYKVFNKNILVKNALDGVDFKADIVIADVPYGEIVSWVNAHDVEVDDFLNNILPVLKKDSIAIIISNKHQKMDYSDFTILENQFIGKRKFVILKLKET